MRTPTGTTLSPTDDVDDDDNVECRRCCCIGECDGAEGAGERPRTSRSNCSAVNMRRPPDLAAMESRVANDVIDDLAARLVREEAGERSGRASTGVGGQ